MKKLLLSSSIVALFVPTLALAAYNDVTLTTSAVFSVGGSTLSISGSSAAIQSATVNASNVVVTLLPGSSISVLASSRSVIGQSGGDTYLTFTECDNNASLMKFVYPSGAGSAATITLTLPGGVCSGGSGGGGGGGGGSVSIPVTPATPASSTTPTVSAVPTAPTSVASSGLSASQIQSILDVLASFNADASTIANVKASLQGVTSGSVTSAAVHVFKADLTIGSLGSEVKALQQFLNSHGFTVAATGGGSPGHETAKFGPSTKAALVKYQKAKGISPASGFLGSKTRAAINAGQ